jgi:hypothetical protein
MLESEQFAAELCAGNHGKAVGMFCVFRIGCAFTDPQRETGILVSYKNWNIY